MVVCIVRLCAGLPDYRTLSIDQIEFFYEGITEELKELTKPRD